MAFSAYVSFIYNTYYGLCSYWRSFHYVLWGANLYSQEILWLFLAPFNTHCIRCKFHGLSTLALSKIEKRKIVMQCLRITNMHACTYIKVVRTTVTTWICASLLFIYLSFIVPWCSSPFQVHAAYKRALLKFHPDRASRTDIYHQVEAEEKFKLISRMKEKFLLPSWQNI